LIDAVGKELQKWPGATVGKRDLLSADFDAGLGIDAWICCRLPLPPGAGRSRLDLYWVFLGWIALVLLLVLPVTAITADMHCVTTWSRLDNNWEGVAFKDLVALVGPRSNAAYVIAHCDADYTTSLSADILADDDVLIAYRHDGAELTPDHGGPLRLVVPKRYAWKSAKWLEGLEWVEHDRLGFWERNGYNNAADPWKEERYW